MPRGRKQFKPKGRGKHYTSQEEVKDQEEKKRKEREWKRRQGQPVSDSEEEEGSDEGATGLSRGAPGELPPTSSDEYSCEEEEDKETKQKGVEGLIDIENPNRVVKKNIKAEHVDVDTEVTLSRREREEIEKHRAAESYRRLHEAGKTDEARNDLARLAIIRQQREDAARKREAERRVAEASEAARKAK